MPDPVPVVVLARLAVDARYQRQGIGAGLVKDAVLRTIQAADIVGARAMLIHALSDEAKKFYEKWGFKASDVDPMTLMLTIAELKRTIGA
jgi:predicted N-acetyltransferase YhbS